MTEHTMIRYDDGKEISPGVRLYSPIVIDPFGQRITFRVNVNGVPRNYMVRNQVRRSGGNIIQVLAFDEVYGILEERLHEAIMRAINIDKERDSGEGNSPRAPQGT